MGAERGRGRPGRAAAGTAPSPPPPRDEPGPPGRKVSDREGDSPRACQPGRAPGSLGREPGPSHGEEGPAGHPSGWGSEALSKGDFGPFQAVEEDVSDGLLQMNGWTEALRDAASDGPPPGQRGSPHSRQHQGVLGEAAGPGMLLVVEQGQGPQDGGQAPPRDQHCRRGRGGSGAGSHHQLCKHGPSVCAGHLLPRAGGQAWAGVWAGSGLGPGELGPRGSRRPGGQACSCPGPVSRGAHPRLPGPWPSVASFSDATPLPPLRRAPTDTLLSPSPLPACQGLPPSSGHCLQEALHDARPRCLSHMPSTASAPLLGCVPPLQGPAQAFACSGRAPETCFYRGPGREGAGF